MDQDSFRKLLTSSNSGRAATARPRTSFLPPKTNVAQTKVKTQGTKDELKPRHLKKKAESAYRDRAGERRDGLAGDFAEVEAVLENFEKQHGDDSDARTIEEQRRYLGGDAEHTVLVKGLDFALLEQQKAKAAAATASNDDDALEAAFLGLDEASPKPAEGPKKRTREEIVQALKNKKSKTAALDASVDDDESKPVDAPLNGSKFKPMGFKPIGSTLSSKNGKELKKKKKKKAVTDANPAPIDANKSSANGQEASQTAKPPTSDPGPSSSTQAKPAVEPDPEPLDEDFNIFADVGDYEGMDFDEDEDDEKGTGEPALGDGTREAPREEDAQPTEARPRKKWFDDEPESGPSVPEIPAFLRLDAKSESRENTADLQRGDVDPDDEDRPIRLSGLGTSSGLSVRDILAADAALEAEDKRKARKEKRKAGGKAEGGEKKKASAETKLNRDYQKLNSYMDKKKAS